MIHIMASVVSVERPRSSRARLKENKRIRKNRKDKGEMKKIRLEDNSRQKVVHGTDVSGRCGLNSLTYVPKEVHLVKQKGLGLVIFHFDCTCTNVLYCETRMAEF